MIEHALDYFLYQDDDAISVAVEQVLGLGEGDAVVKVDRGHTVRTGELTGGDLWLVAPAEVGGYRKLTETEMLSVAYHMGAHEWSGPTDLDRADHAAIWR